MLGETFIQLLPYLEDQPKHTGCHNRHTHTDLPVQSSEDISTSRSSLMPKGDTAKREEGELKPGPRRMCAPSPAVSILSNTMDEYGGLELYRSWCCPTLCKDYPDLQLAGDQLGDRSSQTLCWGNTQADGPLLQSQDLGSLEALPEPRQRVAVAAQRDETYMEMESSMLMPGCTRLSESMLNGYLETKLLEVYRQHMQDSLARCNSTLSKVAMPTLVPSILDEPDSQGTNQEEMEADGTANSSLRYLSTCSAQSLSHFSSPVLRISHTEEPSAPTLHTHTQHHK